LRQSRSPVAIHTRPPAAETNTTEALSQGYAHSARSVEPSGESERLVHSAEGSPGRNGRATTFQPEGVRRSMVGCVGYGRCRQVRKPGTPAAAHVRLGFFAGGTASLFVPQPATTRVSTTRKSLRTSRVSAMRVTTE